MVGARPGRYIRGMSQPPETERQTNFAPAEILSILFGLMLAMLLGALDQTIVATAMPTIGRELGDIEQLPWVVTAYLLASVAVTPLYGKLSDIHGRRIVMLAAISIFVLGSILCALAWSVPALAVARGIQGAGGGGLISLAQTIIADIVAPRERGRYQVYIASVFAVSSLAGPVLGGFLAEHIHWSAIFWINLPLGAAAYAMTSSRLRRLPQVARPHSLDIPGAIVLILGSSSLLLALSWGGVRYPWLSAPILGQGTFTCALKQGGALFCWGSGGFGQLGLSSVASFTTPQKVPSVATWKMGAIGNEHTCGVRATGELACWGASNFAQLGSGSPFASSPVLVVNP